MWIFAVLFAVIRYGALHVTADETQLFIMLLLRVTTIKLFFFIIRFICLWFDKPRHLVAL